MVWGASLGVAGEANRKIYCSNRHGKTEECMKPKRGRSDVINARSGNRGDEGLLCRGLGNPVMWSKAEYLRHFKLDK